MHSTAEKQFQKLFCHCELFWTTQSSTSRAAQTVQHNKSGNVALEKYMHRTWVVASGDNVAVNKQRSAPSTSLVYTTQTNTIVWTPVMSIKMIHKSCGDGAGPQNGLGGNSFAKPANCAEEHSRCKLICMSIVSTHRQPANVCCQCCLLLNKRQSVLHCCVALATACQFHPPHIAVQLISE